MFLPKPHHGSSRRTGVHLGFWSSLRLFSSEDWFPISDSSMTVLNGFLNLIFLLPVQVVFIGFYWLIHSFFKFYLFLLALGLHRSAWTSHHSCFSHCGAQALGAWASVVVALGLNGCGAHALVARCLWNLPGLGIEPCPLHEQVDSYSLNHQGIPLPKSLVHFFHHLVLLFFLRMTLFLPI